MSIYEFGVIVLSSLGVVIWVTMTLRHHTNTIVAVVAAVAQKNEQDNERMIQSTQKGFAIVMARSYANSLSNKHQEKVKQNRIKRVLRTTPNVRSWS